MNLNLFMKYNLDVNNINSVPPLSKAIFTNVNSPTNINTINPATCTIVVTTVVVVVSLTLSIAPKTGQPNNIAGKLKIMTGINSFIK